MKPTDRVIHVWMVDFSAITNKKILDRYLALLTPDEEARRRRFLFENDRLRFLVTRALVRTVLSRYVSIAPKAWLFAADAHGRPRIVNEEAKDPNISFNVSHTENLILLAVGPGTAVGIDVENRRRRSAPLEIIERYFAPEEVRALRALAPERQQDRFFDYWTLKESYIKARGMGLAIPLDHFSFSFPAEKRITFHLDQSLGNNPEHWRFWQFNPSDEYVAALCSEAFLQEPSAAIKRIIPLCEESSFETIALQPGYRGT